MSRSNPTDNTPNPAVRWFEWNGEQGGIRYYDKDAKQNVDVASPFTFLLLDQLGSVRGWHESSQSGIYSNEVRDTRQDVLLVKAFKLANPIAEGLYKSIKDKVAVAGGQFVANCYVAFKNGGEGLEIGSLKFKGAALGAWMEFCKNNRASLYKKAVEIAGYTEGKKGRVIFRVPQFRLKELSEDTNNQAIGLDRQLQEFLTAYLARTKRDQVDTHPPHTDDDYQAHGPVETPDEDSIPF